MSHPLRRAAALALLGLALAPAAARADTAAPGTVLEAVYVDTLWPGEIRRGAQAFFEGLDSSRARYAVRAYRVRYSSTDFDGSPAEISAQLFVPVHALPSGFPVLVFGSGTTGVDDRCAPSLEQPDVRRWGCYRANMLAYAAEGFITIFPDYLGFNDPLRGQRYFSKAAEAHVMLDAVRAVYGFFAEPAGSRVAGASPPLPARPSRAVFAAGYSQGGHAAFAAADLRAQYAPEVPLSGVLGFGATTDVAALLREGPVYAPYILHTYRQMYGAEEVDPSLLLQERWASCLEDDAGRLCVDQFQQYYPTDPGLLYTPEFLAALLYGTLPDFQPRLEARLQENRSGLAGHRLPALVVHGLADTVVSTRSQTAFVEALTAAGSAVRYLRLPGVRHRQTRAAGFRVSIEWMESLAREGQTPPPAAHRRGGGPARAARGPAFTAGGRTLTPGGAAARPGEGRRRAGRRRGRGGSDGQGRGPPGRSAEPATGSPCGVPYSHSRASRTRRERMSTSMFPRLRSTTRSSCGRR